MPNFLAVKQKINDNTGEVEEFEHIIYLADRLQNAVQNCLYTLRLKNRRANIIGKSGQVIEDGFGFCWCVVPVKKDLEGNELVYRAGNWYKS